MQRSNVRRKANSTPGRVLPHNNGPRPGFDWRLPRKSSVNLFLLWKQHSTTWKVLCGRRAQPESKREQLRWNTNWVYAETEVKKVKIGSKFDFSKIEPESGFWGRESWKIRVYGILSNFWGLLRHFQWKLAVLTSKRSKLDYVSPLRCKDLRPKVVVSLRDSFALRSVRSAHLVKM